MEDYVLRRPVPAYDAYLDPTSAASAVEILERNLIFPEIGCDAAEAEAGLEQTFTRNRVRIRCYGSGIETFGVIALNALINTQGE